VVALRPGDALDKRCIVIVLQEFKAATYPATVMQRHAKAYAALEIQALADCNSQQKRT